MPSINPILIFGRCVLDSGKELLTRTTKFFPFAIRIGMPKADLVNKIGTIKSSTKVCFYFLTFIPPSESL